MSNGSGSIADTACIQSIPICADLSITLLELLHREKRKIEKKIRMRNNSSTHITKFAQKHMKKKLKNEKKKNNSHKYTHIPFWYRNHLILHSGRSTLNAFRLHFDGNYSPYFCNHLNHLYAVLNRQQTQERCFLGTPFSRHS